MHQSQNLFVEIKDEKEKHYLYKEEFVEIKVTDLSEQCVKR